MSDRPATDSLVNLLVEDDPELSEMYRLKSVQAGYQVRLASDGQGGLQTALKAAAGPAPARPPPAQSQPQSDSLCVLTALPPSSLMVPLTETVVVGGDHLANLERLHGDSAATELRAVAAAPAPATAGQLLERRI